MKVEKGMKPILVNAEMALAIQGGRKTVTRRAIKVDGAMMSETTGNMWAHGCQYDPEEFIEQFSRFRKGDILWVREPAVLESYIDTDARFELIFRYKSDNDIKIISDLNFKSEDEKFGFAFKKIHGKKWAEDALLTGKGRGVPNGRIKEVARTFVKVTDVEVEYLQDIGDDYKAEGFDALDDFIATWDKVAPRGYRWDDTPLVWVYRFEEI